MTQIKGNQIASNSMNFDVFVTDDNGNIVLPDNVTNIVKQSDVDTAIQNALTDFSVNKVVEKISIETDGKYSISQEPLGDVLVMINGVVQTPGDDYTMNNQDIEFTTAPGINDKIVASYIVKG